MIDLKSITLGLTGLLFACLCLGQSSGLQIEYGPNLGVSYTDSTGTGRFYMHMTATITNDTTIPIQFYGALAKKYAFPNVCQDTNTFEVFLLPRELTPDTATIYNNIVNGEHDYLYRALDDPNAFTQTIAPGEFCVVTIGVLHTKPSNCAAVPRGVISHDSIHLYTTCDRLTNNRISGDPRLAIGAKLEYYYKRKFISPEDGCVIIPFGTITYAEG